MTLTPEVKKVIDDFCSFTQNGKVHPNYLRKIEVNLEELGIETEEEAVQHFKEWLKKRRNSPERVKSERTKAPKETRSL